MGKRPRGWGGFTELLFFSPEGRLSLSGEQGLTALRIDGERTLAPGGEALRVTIAVNTQPCRKRHADADGNTHYTADFALDPDQGSIVAIVERVIPAGSLSPDYGIRLAEVIRQEIRRTQGLPEGETLVGLIHQALDVAKKENP